MNAHDRCDACGTIAQVLVRNEQGSELTFCGHHLNRNAEMLESLGYHTVATQNTTGEEVPA